MYERFLRLHRGQDFDYTTATIKLKQVDDAIARLPRPALDSDAILFTGKTLTIEAEQAPKLVKPMQAVADDSASGGAFVAVWPRTTESREIRVPRMVFYIAVDKPTTIQLEGHVRTPTFRSNSFFVGVAAGKQLEAPLRRWDFPERRDWQWSVYGETIRLEKGVHSLIIAVREDETPLDAIRISAAGN